MYESNIVDVELIYNYQNAAEIVRRKISKLTYEYNSSIISARQLTLTFSKVKVNSTLTLSDERIP